MMSNSALLSSLLAKQWGLPKDLYDALRFALTPMTGAPSGGPDSEGRSAAEASEALLLYIACRIGDAVAYQGLKDLDDFALLNGDDLDLFLLPAYLQEFSLQELVPISRDRKHNRRAQQAIANFSG